MKRVNFNYIKAKNFLSIGEEEVHVAFRQGINVITGLNKDKADRRNAVGKSTVADSIHFALFGETIREISKPNIPNQFTSGKTHVELGLDVTVGDKTTRYKIIRTIKPTKCYLIVDDVDQTESTISNTNARIRDIVSGTPELFQNCVIMSLNTTLPFMAQKKNEKRKFIEGILKLEVFSKMLSSVRVDHTEAIRNFETSSRELVHQANYKDMISTQIEHKKNERSRLEDQYSASIDKKNKRIEQITDKHIPTPKQTLISVSEKLTAVKSIIKEHNAVINKVKENIITNRAEIKSLEQRLSETAKGQGTCPVCLKEITSDDVEHIKNERTRLDRMIQDRENDIDELQLQSTNLQKRVGAFEEIKNHCEQYINLFTKAVENNNRNSQLIKDIEIEIDDLQKDINNIVDDADTTDLVTKLEEHKSKITELENTVNKTNHDKKILDYVKWIVGEEGVRSFIVKKILNILNSRMHHYLKEMDANCICTFNEYFEEEIKNEKGVDCSYFNFSGAERKNIDLACLFTFMDIRRMQGDVTYNLVMFDELLDSSLDERGSELVLAILKDRVETYGEGVYIISHRRESIKEHTGDIIFLEKSDGVTRRVEYKK